MSVPVVQIGVVRMAVEEPRMRMTMRVQLAYRHARRMPVLVMCVMRMCVLVGERLVKMLVVVSLREVEPDADGHQSCAHD
jgi:hypothetical protein